MTSGRILPCLVVSATALSTLGAIAVARAAPLDDEACARAKSEHRRLKAGGIEKDMARGPAWALVNLATERLDQVQRFIELEELLVFRCRDKTLVTLPSKRELAARRKAARKEKAAGTASTGAQAPSQWGTTVTRSPTAPGSDDTYTPGSPAPTFDPFAN